MKKIHKNLLIKQSGFSLVELMVGLVVGLIAAFVIINVFSTFETQKRATTGTGDAQTNASIALYNIQREVQKAGFGLPIFDGNLEESASGDQTNNHSALRCVSATPATVPALPIDHDGLPGSPPVDGAIPISIADGGAGSDSITVGFSTPNANLPVGAAPARTTIPVPAGVVALDTASGIANSLQVTSNIGCKQGDIVVVVRGANCTSRRVTTSDGDLNNNPQRMQLTSVAGIADGSKLTCIGLGYNVVSFSVAGNELFRGTTPIISEIVDMQAQYGITATNNSNEVTQWVNAPALTDRKRIRAIRVAVVSRNNQLEQGAPVTTACSSLNSANPTGLCAWAGTAGSPAPLVNLAAIGGGQYRYRVYEAIIPLRNLSFSGALL